ncbi:MAG: cell wall-binding repeat-containing protein [Candidatus Thermoplasmatota archaeon]
MKRKIAIVIVFILLFTSFTGCVQKKEEKKIVLSGYEGISWKKVIPMKNAIIVNYEKASYIDDYAYLASVPASVFHSKKNDVLFSSPLIYYEKPYFGEEKEKTLNSSQGINYFMEDWVKYDNGLENILFINFPLSEAKELAKKWNAKNFKLLHGSTPYKIGKEIALYNWEYSDEAVVVPIFEKREKKRIENKIDAKIPGDYKISKLKIEGKKNVGITPVYHNFTIDKPNKYISAIMRWDDLFPRLSPITQRGKDPDMQLYDWQIGEVAASENWNVLEGPYESFSSYVYNNGPWGIGVTYMPTESLSEVKLPQNPLTTARYEIDITLYPGVEYEIPDKPGFMARNATFEFSSNGNFGLSIIGEDGAELCFSTTSPIHLDQLGEGKYKAVFVKLQDNGEMTSTLKYSWEEEKKDFAYALSSQTNGAIIASIKNIPLLFVEQKKIPDETKEALDVLGVKKVYVVDASNSISRQIFNYRSLLQPKIEVVSFSSLDKIYSYIKKITKSNDVIFTTIEPWAYWFVGSEGTEGMHEKGLFIGPSAYAAAHHGSPLFILELHPLLSIPLAWHNEYWKDAYESRYPPSVGGMVLTGRSIYKFLNSIGFDEDGKESILTIADQFNIGSAWDRALVGASISGRITGSPVDVSYWLSRSSLYQAIIYASPALNETGTKMVTGTESIISPGPETLNPIYGKEVEVKYPITCSWVSYEHRFNERASRYWGANYITADGITPYWSNSDEEIDDGVNAEYGRPGKYWADIRTSEVVPFYAEKLEYGIVYSTNFKDTVSNLNSSIMWLEIMHGSNRGSGVLGFWDDGKKHNEKNPWRGYEISGSTREPDTYATNKHTGGDAFHRSVSEYDRDGIVIAIAQQEQTIGIDGYQLDNALGNIHSVGVNAGSCLIANTYLHLALIRHGSVFQVIDPWLTSWYAGFAMQTFVRDLALGMNVGEAYERGIAHVGIEYLVNQWWWDIFENVVYYGDPKLTVFSPKYKWERPEPLKDWVSIDGHTPFGSKEHKEKISSMVFEETILYLGIAITIFLFSYLLFRKMKRRK